jgi:hypothetical protein
VKFVGEECRVWKREFKGKTLTELLKLKGENRKLIIHRADVGTVLVTQELGGGKSVQELILYKFVIK